MKLLFDQNLSPRLVSLVADLFPYSAHVQSLGLDCASDDQIWAHARDQGFVIVSKGADYDDMVLVRGFPPKIIWLQIGNCKTPRVAEILRANQVAIEALGLDPATGIICLQ